MTEKKKILIIEDERDIVKVLTIRLQGRGYYVIAAFDALQGFSVALKEKPDLIILDIRMPAGGGLSVAEKLKRSTLTWTIPIIILTGSSEKDIEAKAKKLGVQFYIKKPYDPEELLDAVIAVPTLIE